MESLASRDYLSADLMNAQGGWMAQVARMMHPAAKEKERLEQEGLQILKHT